MRLFLHHCISDGNQLFSEHFGYHFNFIFYVMSDKAGFVSGALLCVQRYQRNLELSRYNREFIFIFNWWISVCYTNILFEFLLKCSAIKSIKNLLKILNFLWLWTNEWNAFVRVSLHLENARETVSLTMLSVSTCFFSLEQETLWHSRYMIWQIFMERATAPHYNKLSFMFS